MLLEGNTYITQQNGNLQIIYGIEWFNNINKSAFLNTKYVGIFKLFMN